MVTPNAWNVSVEKQGMTDKIVVLSTCGSAEEAERLARELVEQHAAACVNIVAPVRSIYRWKGAIEDASEWLLIVKTERALFDRLRAVLEAAHSYELPEVLALPVIAGSPNYLGWIESELKQPDATEIRALIFDMDGVLIDSNPVHRAAWAEYNRGHGVETTEAMQMQMYGKRNDEIVRDFLGAHLTDADVTAHGAAKERLYREMMRARLGDALVPGVRDFIMRQRDLPIALATNAEPANVDFVLDGAGMRDLFRAIVDGHQVSNPKPHPEIYLRAADFLGVAPEFCVVFEDSETGVQAGLSAGMRVVGVSTTHEELPGVSLQIDSFRDPALETWLRARLPSPAAPAM
jgi:beta-phosphoglucomutase family hydrolase